MGFSRQGYWSGLPFPSPGDLPKPGIKLASLVRRLLRWQADSLSPCHLGNLLQELTFLPSVALGVAYHGNADSAENNFVCKAKPDLTLTLSSPDFWFLSKGQIVISYRHYGKKNNQDIWKPCLDLDYLLWICLIWTLIDSYFTFNKFEHLIVSRTCQRFSVSWPFVSVHACEYVCMPVSVNVCACL